MPKSALKYVAVDRCARLADISDLLAHRSGTIDGDRVVAVTGAVTGQVARGPQAEEDAVMSGNYELKRPVALTCPDCGGCVRETVVDTLPCYTCHIGHRFAAANMDVSQFERMENALVVALRTLNERVELCRQMAATSKANGQV